jgi:hypothetical protein
MPPQVKGLDPPSSERVPEQVVAGGVDDLNSATCPDGEVIQVAVVFHEDGGDRLDLVVAGGDVEARILSPGLRLAMGMVLPLASRTRVPGAKDSPPQTRSLRSADAFSSIWIPASVAALSASSPSRKLKLPAARS